MLSGNTTIFNKTDIVMRYLGKFINSQRQKGVFPIRETKDMRNMLVNSFAISIREGDVSKNCRDVDDIAILRQIF